MVANNIARHLPGNPTVIASNMPGGGGRKLANYLYNVAPKDGSAIAIIHHTTVYDAAFGTKGVHYDSTRFNWLGSMAGSTLFALAWHTTGVKTFEDARNKEISMGATGAGATSFQYLSLLKNMFGAKFKIVTGYKGARNIYLAIEQQELDGTGGMTWSVFRNNYDHLVKEKKVNLLVQIALRENPQLPGVPLIMDFARSPEEKRLLEFVLAGLQFARPFMAPPGMPKATVNMLRAAMTAVATDPQLLAEAKKRRFDIDPTDGVTVQKMVEDIYNTPQDIKAKAKTMLTGK
jgi:tripartite-type tricarboxylate transporter receptor subunit TctC